MLLTFGFYFYLQLYHTERTRDVALFDERWQEMHHPWLYPSGMELGKKFNNTISEEHQSKLKDEAKNLDWAQSDHMVCCEMSISKYSITFFRQYN